MAVSRDLFAVENDNHPGLISKITQKNLNKFSILASLFIWPAEKGSGIFFSSHIPMVFAPVF
jgi:hypothetical protein